jgi:hypothetical protein
VVDEERHVPAGQKVGERAPDEDDVLVALADDLVRDRNVSATRVVDVRDLARAASTPPVTWSRSWLAAVMAMLVSVGAAACSDSGDDAGRIAFRPRQLTA